jgi:hypothetical protein
VYDYPVFVKKHNHSIFAKGGLGKEFSYTSARTNHVIEMRLVDEVEDYRDFGGYLPVDSHNRNFFFKPLG